MRRLLFWLTLTSCVPVPDNAAPPPEVPQPSSPIQTIEDGIHHQVNFDAANSHYLTIETTINKPGAELMMAVWTPGSYLVREYARNIESLSVTDPSGAPVKLTRVQKNRWLLDGDHEAIRITYRLYCRELSVRTNWVDSDFAILNGASTFLVPPEQLDRPHTISLTLPESWTGAKSGLPVDEKLRFVARNFDTLIDSPIVAGTPTTKGFEVNSVPHEIVYIGGDGLWDFDKTTADVKSITSAISDFWGGPLPYDDYTYLNVISEGQGGLEHKNSTLMLSSRWKTDTRDDYIKWLGLVSHEFFHTWNVKRLRPKALGPFNYEKEVYTPSLWIAEGITSYYDDLLLARGGLIDQKEYLSQLSKQFTTLHKTPGRLVHPLAQTSQDAWIKFYRKDENFKNSSVSYYVKGAVVAFLLDAEIRRATEGTKSLDDLMRLAYQRFSGDSGFETEEFRALANEVAGTSLDSFFQTTIDSATELDYSSAFDWYGLEFDTVDPPTDGHHVHLGIELAGTTISGIAADGPNAGADIQVDDEVIAIDNFRLLSGELDQRLARVAEGESVEVLLSRRGKLRTVTLQLGPKPWSTFSLQVAAEATPQQTRYFTDLLATK
jgi:predicted metalloprotease with PDZ domain